MAERDEEFERDPDRWALIGIDPIEEVISGDGRGFIAGMSVTASDDEIAEIATEEFLRMTGGEKIGKDSGSNSVAFSAGKWNSPWQPKGPKPNWRVESSPSEPSLN